MYKFTLQDHQEKASRFAIEHPYCGLFLPMGCGKTLSTLLAIDKIGIYPWLVIAPPMVAKYTWKFEAQKWELPLRIISLDGSMGQRERILNTFEADIYTVSPDNFVNMYKKGSLDHVKNVVIDEISMFRSTKSTRHKTMVRMRPMLDRLIGLTGTPCPNGIISIFGIIKIIDSDILGRYKTKFHERYFRATKYRGPIPIDWVPLPGAEEEIYAKILPVTYSCPKPNLNIECRLIDTYVEMDMKAKKLYNKLKKHFLLEFGDGVIEAATAAILTNKLQQMANGIVYMSDKQTKVIHDAKLLMLKDLLAQADDNVLIVYNYVSDLSSITNNTEAEIFNLDRWNQRKQKVSIINAQSGGHGLNLQSGGSILIFYGTTWNAELYEQMICRLFRKGQTRDVRVYRILTKGTIDERIIKALETKCNVQESLLKAVREEYECQD